MTKEEAEALLIGLRVRGERLDTSSEDGRVHAESIKCALTLARAGAAVMFPSEEEVFELTYAAQHLRDVAGLSVFPADSSWPARLREIADMIAAMKPMEVERA